MTYTIGDLLISQTVKTDSTVSSELEYVQGDIWIANLENKALGHEQGGNRPVLIISDTTWNRKSGSQLYTLDNSRLINRVGKTSKSKLLEVRKIINKLLWVNK